MRKNKQNNNNMRKLENSETFTIVKKGTDNHYDTNDERFYGGTWERTQDSKKYLERIMENNPDKFEGCVIEVNELNK